MITQLGLVVFVVLISALSLIFFFGTDLKVLFIAVDDGGGFGSVLRSGVDLGVYVQVRSRDADDRLLPLEQLILALR